MRNFLTYLAVFVTSAVLMQLFLLDSMRLGVWFAPMAYIAFVVLLPINARSLAVLLLGFALGAFMDFFEGTAGLHTAATLLTAYVRRGVMRVTLGKDVVEEETVMPSCRSVGGGKFLRYSAALVGVHCLGFFSLEALSWEDWPGLLVRTLVSWVVSVVFVWAVGELFSMRSRRRV